MFIIITGFWFIDIIAWVYLVIATIIFTLQAYKYPANGLLGNLKSGILWLPIFIKIFKKNYDKYR